MSRATVTPKPSDRRAAPADTLPVRWLAELCGVRPFPLLPRLASALLDEAGPASPLAAYLAWWIRHAQPGGYFAQATRHLTHMPDAVLIETLRRTGYDGLLYHDNGQVACHTFFQRHGADLCIFSGAVDEPNRGARLWATILTDVVAFAAQLPDVQRARVGSGPHPMTHKLVALIAPHAAVLGWDVSADGLIDFRKADRPQA